jgi:hypothetical protein
MTDETPLLDTLGRRFEAQARRIAARRLPVYPWARPLGVLLDHLTSLPAPFEGRFERTESPLAGAELDIRRPGEHAAWDLPTIYAAPTVGRPLPATESPPASGKPDSRRPGERAAWDLPAIYAAPAVGRPLSADLQERLREVAGRGAEALRVHDDAVADATARAHQADAVTVGPDVFFRQGQFRPHEPRGFGLLVHEATHVLGLLRPGAAWRRATSTGVQEEEEAALAQERAAVSRLGPTVGQGRVETGRLSRPPTQSAPPAAPGAATRATPLAAPALRPMTAEADRDVSVPAPAPAPVDLQALRQGLVQDLMRQLRAEFERGG